MILAPTGSVLWINFEYLNLQSHSKTIFVYFCKRICKYPNLVTICLSQADLYLGNKAQIHLPPLYLGSFCATLKFVNGIGCLLASWHQCLLLPTCKHYGCELYVDSISEPPPPFAPTYGGNLHCTQVVLCFNLTQRTVDPNDVVD